MSNWSVNLAVGKEFKKKNNIDYINLHYLLL